MLEKAGLILSLITWVGIVLTVIVLSVIASSVAAAISLSIGLVSRFGGLSGGKD